MKPKPIQIYLVLMSTGYCIYDLYICFFEIKYNFREKEAAEFLFHHTVGILGAAGSFFCGRFNLPLSSGALLSEASNMMMNYRWFMIKH
mmetsp:Transcript_1441/g.1741  ORF Transcript_1441/g.1741 Transcript_1441/m.1741 type:complete len:89 (+) Transcript_1441:333-599(+)